MSPEALRSIYVLQAYCDKQEVILDLRKQHLVEGWPDEIGEFYRRKILLKFRRESKWESP